MNPVIPDRAYLEHEHLLIAVKSEDGDELYGVWNASETKAVAASKAEYL